MGVVLAQASFGSLTNTPCLGARINIAIEERHHSYYATVVHHGPAGIMPTLRAGSYR